MRVTYVRVSHMHGISSRRGSPETDDSPACKSILGSFADGGSLAGLKTPAELTDFLDMDKVKDGAVAAAVASDSETTSPDITPANESSEWETQPVGLLSDDGTDATVASTGPPRVKLDGAPAVIVSGPVAVSAIPVIGGVKAPPVPKEPSPPPPSSHSANDGDGDDKNADSKPAKESKKLQRNRASVTSSRDDHMRISVSSNTFESPVSDGASPRGRGSVTSAVDHASPLGNSRGESTTSIDASPCAFGGGSRGSSRGDSRASLGGPGLSPRLSSSRADQRAASVGSSTTEVSPRYGNGRGGDSLLPVPPSPLPGAKRQVEAGSRSSKRRRTTNGDSTVGSSPQLLTVPAGNDVVESLKQLGRDTIAAKVARAKGQVDSLMDKRRKLERDEAAKPTEKEQRALLDSLATAMALQIALQLMELHTGWRSARELRDVASTWDLLFKLHFGQIRFSSGGGELALHLAPVRHRVAAVLKYRQFADGPHPRSRKDVEKAFRTAKPALESRVKYLKTAQGGSPYKDYVQWVHLAAEAEMLWLRAADGDRSVEPPPAVAALVQRELARDVVAVRPRLDRLAAVIFEAVRLGHNAAAPDDSTPGDELLFGLSKEGGV